MIPATSAGTAALESWRCCRAAFRHMKELPLQTRSRSTGCAQASLPRSDTLR